LLIKIESKIVSSISVGDDCTCAQYVATFTWLKEAGRGPEKSIGGSYNSNHFSKKTLTPVRSFALYNHMTS